MSESTKDEGIIKANVSRRSLLKWSGALAAAGIIGIGLGIGGDLLIRPSVTKITTSTASGRTATTTTTATSTATGPTTTLTVPPTTLSYVPPLSPSTQTTVDNIVSQLISIHQGESVSYMVCAQDGCMDTCIMRVRSKNGIVTALEPDDTINNGIRESFQDVQTGMYQQRGCSMGYAWRSELYAPDRILYPMKRVGPRGVGGSLTRISWDEALSTIANAISNTTSTYGPSSIYMKINIWGFCGYALEGVLGGAIAGWGSYSHGGCFAAWNHVLGGAGGAPWTGWYWTPGNHSWDPSISGAGTGATDLLNAKLIILWPWNVVQAEWPNDPYVLLQAKEQGIPIICIDPKYTTSAEVLADQWIPIRPSTDIAMMLAVANVWFKENLYDQDFVNKWVEPTGFAAWQAYVLGQTAGPDGAIDRTPEWAAPICGVPAATIQAFAELYANTKPAHLRCGWTNGRYMWGENVPRAAIYLQAMSGNMCCPGGSEPNNIIGGGMLGPAPSVNWQRGGTTLPQTMMSAVRWPAAVLQRSAYDNGTITQDEYKSQTGTIGSVMPNIRLMIQDGNEMTQFCNCNNNFEALQMLDTIVCFAWHSSQALAYWGDIVLPATLPFFEGDVPSGDTLGNLIIDRFNSNSQLGNWWLYNDKIVQAPGEAEGVEWVFTHLANLLGVGQQWNPLLYNVPDDQWDAQLDSMHQAAYEVWAAQPGVVSQLGTMPSWTDFKKMPVVRYPIGSSLVPAPYYSFKGDIEAGKSPFRNNASGKIEFYSNFLAQGADYLAANDFLGVAFYGPWNAAPMAEWQAGIPGTFFAPDSGEYPLLLISSHQWFRQHSTNFNNPALRNNVYRHAIWLSAADATARGIVDGDTVRVYNSYGEMYVPVYVTSRVTPGVAVMYEGGYYVPSSATSDLMPSGIDLGGCMNFLMLSEPWPYSPIGTTFSANNVQVELLESSQNAASEETVTTTTTPSSASTTTSTDTNEGQRRRR